MSVTDSEILEWVEFAKGKTATKEKGNPAVVAASKKHKAKVKKALAESIVGVSAAIALAQNGGDPASALQVNNTPVTSTIGGMYQDVQQAAEKHAGALLALGIGTMLAARAASGEMNPIAAKIASGIGDTTMLLAAGAITNGMKNKLGKAAIMAAVVGEIAAEHRAMMIANTEANRGFNLGVRNTLQANGAQMQIIAADGACPECQAQDGLPVTSDADLPPFHPDCMCEIGILANPTVNS